MRIGHFGLGVVVVFCLGLVSEPVQADLEKYSADSKAVIKQFFGSLKGELVAAIKEGGPVNAIGVCNSKAPEIAHDLEATKQGWSIGRTSLKLRNPGNAPDDWEKAVLMDFEARKAQGEDPMTMARAEIVTMNGQKIFRFMKAIPTAEKPCLACHGADVSPDVEAKLKALYPDDKARGYKPGDIRGAFTISFPVN